MSVTEGKGQLRREAGWYQLIDPDGKIIEGRTYFCVHCGGHFMGHPGSGVLRGFCQHCNGYVCGIQCAQCQYFERGIDNIEKGLDWYHKPIVVSLAGCNVPQHLVSDVSMPPQGVSILQPPRPRLLVAGEVFECPREPEH